MFLKTCCYQKPLLDTLKVNKDYFLNGINMKCRLSFIFILIPLKKCNPNDLFPYLIVWAFIEYYYYWNIFCSLYQKAIPITPLWWVMVNVVINTICVDTDRKSSLILWELLCALFYVQELLPPLNLKYLLCRIMSV